MCSLSMYLCHWHLNELTASVFDILDPTIFRTHPAIALDFECPAFS